MNPLSRLLCVLSFFAAGVIGRAQTITISINQPGAGQIVHESAQIRVNITSTFELQGVQASIENHSVALAPAGVDAWTNALLLTGLSYGNKTLTITATDVFANSNQVQRTVLYDLPPTITVNSPSHESVVRSNLFLNAIASDDGPSGAVITVMQAIDYSGGGVLATGNNSVSTNVFFSDHEAVSVFFKNTDSSGQFAGAFRVIYVERSTNLVEVARVSDGEIQDVSPDRILFKLTDNHAGIPNSYDSSTHFSLMVKSRVDGTETVLYDDMGKNVYWNFLAPQGAVFVLDDSYATSQWYQLQGGTQVRQEPLAKPFTLAVKGNFAAWDGNYFSAGLRFADLLSTNTYVVTNIDGTMAFDLADNGDLVFMPQPSGNDGHQILRYRNGVVTLLANDPVNTNSNPKTDGNNVCYIKNTPTNKVLMVITNGVEAQIATGVAFGSDLQINNGWLAYSRDGGNGIMQVWRRFLNGTNTQLTFFGSSSSVAALAPNGEVAVYNGLDLCISKGIWPPMGITTSPTVLLNFITPALKPFWQDGRWYATLGGSLFQIYTGNPQIQKLGLSNGVVQLDIMGASGQHAVTQVSSNFIDWVDIATNSIIDGANLKVTEPVSNASSRFYRLQVR